MFPLAASAVPVSPVLNEPPRPPLRRVVYDARRIAAAIPGIVEALGARPGEQVLVHSPCIAELVLELAKTAHVTSLVQDARLTMDGAPIDPGAYMRRRSGPGVVHVDGRRLRADARRDADPFFSPLLTLREPAVRREYGLFVSLFSAHTIDPDIEYEGGIGAFLKGVRADRAVLVVPDVSPAQRYELRIDRLVPDLWSRCMHEGPMSLSTSAWSLGHGPLRAKLRGDGLLNEDLRTYETPAGKLRFYTCSR